MAGITAQHYGCGTNFQLGTASELTEQKPGLGGLRQLRWTLANPN